MFRRAVRNSKATHVLRQKSLFSIVLLCILQVLSFNLYAEAPKAGTIISNQAYATYFSLIDGIDTTINSNIVSATVLPVEALTLTSDQTGYFRPASFVEFSHQLTNTGNTPTDYVITFGNLPGDTYDFPNINAYQDITGNGVIDSTDIVINTGDMLNLDISETVSIIISTQTPSGLLSNDEGRIFITASSIGGEMSFSNQDTVLAGNSPVLRMNKQASLLNAAPGDTISYRIVTTNTGTADAQGELVTIDNSSVKRVLILDQIPLNTTFISATSSDGQIIYRTTGMDQKTFVSAIPSDLSSIIQIGAAFSVFPVSHTNQLNMLVSVNRDASGATSNQAISYYIANGSRVESISNRTDTFVIDQAPDIFFLDSSYNSVAQALTVGNPVYVEAHSAKCNLRSDIVETRQIIITSVNTGDREVFYAVETTPNSARFRLDPIPTASNESGVFPGNGIIELTKDDTLIATFPDCGGLVEANVLIDPAGVVYDSRNNKPIEGAEVRLIDVTGAGNGGYAGGPAVVYETDGITLLPATQITGINGAFEFPLVPQSTYRIEIIPPFESTYQFPSVLVSNLQPPGRIIDRNGSYGYEFDVNLSTGPVYFDIPLDQIIPDGLLMTNIKVDRQVVEVGEFVNFEVTITNNAEQYLPRIESSNFLPAGFSYVKNSLRYHSALVIDSPPPADPIEISDSGLKILVGSLSIESSVTYSYQTRVRRMALSGDGIFRSQAISYLVGGHTAVSNIDAVKIQVDPGVFTDDAYVIGKVFIDCDRDRVQGVDDVGVPRVRLYLEDGTSVITDEEGKFSFYGVTPGTHVVKVDNITLPEDAELMSLDNRSAGDPASRFIDLKKGEIHKSNFALTCHSAKSLQEIKNRREEHEIFTAEITKGVKHNLDLETNRPKQEAGLLEASGYKSNEDKSFSGLKLRKAYDADNHLLSTNNQYSISKSDGIDIETIMPDLNNKPDFIGIDDGATLDYAQAPIVVKGRMGTNLILEINGERIDESRIGKRSSLEKNQLVVHEYVGIDFIPGENVLKISQADNFGNERGHKEIRIFAPGNLENLDIEMLTDAVADGVTPVLFRLSLTDGDGIPVTSRVPVTLDTNVGRLTMEDMNPRDPGTQTFISGGEGVFELLPPDSPQQDIIRVRSGIIYAEKRLQFRPYLRPMLATGVIEGRFNLSDFDISQLIPAREEDNFEAELQTLSSSNDGRAKMGARAALFLKGKIKGEYLLTLSYDSGKQNNQELFRDIQPDKFYPVYGDSAVRNYDAQSTGKLYVRVEQNNSYLLYGDYHTGNTEQTRILSRYQRSLRGLQYHLEGDKGILDVFAANSRSSYREIEIPGMGVSGPYYIEDTKVRFHSETVSIIVRDRDQFNQVLETRFLARYVDYTLDPFSGELNFKTPVPSLDHNLNPVYIRVDYETESHDESYTTSGISGQYKLFDNLQLGGVYIQDDNPLDEMQLTGTNLLMKISENTLFAAEHAITDKPGIGKGSATRYELTYKNDQHQARIFYTDTDKLFDNRTSMYSQGRSESGIRADFRLTTSTLLKTELIQTKNTQDNSRLAGGQISLQQKLGDHLVVEVSGRHVETENTAQDNQNESDSISVKLSSQLPWHEKISLFAQVEQDTHDSDKKMAAIGGDYQLGVGTRLYGRHEFISTLGNTYGFTNTTERNATVFGIDSKYRQGASIFSEYRIRDSISGEDAEAAVGLQNSWIPSEGLKLNTRFEKIESLEGTTATEQTAASISLEYTGSARWKASSRVEWREGAQSSSTLFNLNMAYKLNRNMSFLGKWTDSNVDYSAQGEDRKNRLQIGIAWRDTDSDKLSVLGKLEWRGEDKPQPSGVKTERHIVIMSLHANYQPYRNIILNGRYAGKDVTELTSGRQSQHTAHLFSGRMTYDFRERWDMSVLASNYFDQGGKSRQYGLGVEIGYLLHANLWLSAGYNFFGYEDNDLINADYTQPGIYLRLRFKFDENLFKQSPLAGKR